MAKIILLSDKSKDTQGIETLLQERTYQIKTVLEEDELFKTVETFLPDIALIDTNCPDINISFICKSLKMQGQTNDTQIILLTCEKTITEEIMAIADGYILKPFNENILIATINAHLRIKKLLDILYTNNSDLAKSLYQLNVLYSTSSQLAGTLDKSKLINIMSEGLEKSLSFSLCSTLVINDNTNVKLIINSLKPITDRLEEALKLRAMIGYKNLFESGNAPFDFSINTIQVEKHYKNQDSIYDLNVLDYNKLFMPIKTTDKFFGTVEVFRDTELISEDLRSLETVIKQVSLPLESAFLYEEITETNKKLEKLEQLKSEFISIVSHELRTPLTAIKNALDIMLSGKSGEVTKVMNNFLNMARRNVERLGAIINDLLDLSKIEAGKMDFRFKELDIKEPIDFVLNTLENLAQNKEIKIEVSVEDGLDKVYSDIDKIEQVLSNLIANAIKFTRAKGLIQIKAQKTSFEQLKQIKLFNNEPLLKENKNLSNNFIKVSVEDNGIGIKEEDLPKVFDKFQQIESSLSREVGGTGLGLPIALQLIESHRGKIWVESEFEKGSIFSFILPVMDEKSTFILELDTSINQAKYSHSTLSLLKIQDNSNTSLIEEIMENKIKSFKKRESHKLFRKDNTLNIIMPKTDCHALEFIIKGLKNHTKKAYENCDILISGSTYPQDAISANELVKISEKELILEG